MREQRTGDAAKAAVTEAAVLDGAGGELALPREHKPPPSRVQPGQACRVSAPTPTHRRRSLGQSSTGQRGATDGRSSVLLLRCSSLFQRTVPSGETSLWARRPGRVRATETALAVQEELSPQRGGAETFLDRVTCFLLMAVIVPCGKG